MTPALELGTTPGHGYSLQAVMLFFGSVLQNHDLSRQTSWFLSILAVFFVFARVRHALSRGAASFTVFLHFLLTGTGPKSCLGATSVLNEIFKVCQKFVDHWMPLYSLSKTYWIVVLLLVQFVV